MQDDHQLAGVVYVPLEKWGGACALALASDLLQAGQDRGALGWCEVGAVVADHGVGLFDSRERLMAGLSRYPGDPAAGPLKARCSATTWGQHMSILSLFYRWAINEGWATAEPFTQLTTRAGGDSPASGRRVGPPYMQVAVPGERRPSGKDLVKPVSGLLRNAA